MTRINLVHVEDLADQHLFAEWREIKMIPAKVRKLYHTKTLGELSGIFADIPDEYTMSTGHVRFFYDKMWFLHDRYEELTEELKKRKYNISPANPSAIFILDMPHSALTINYTPTNKEKLINIERISERLNQRPNWYRHYGEIKPPSFFIDRYNQQLTVDILS